MSSVRRWVGSIVAAIVAGGSFRREARVAPGLAGSNGDARRAYRAPRDAVDGVDDADIEPDRIDDPLAADDDGLDEDPTGH